MSRRPAPACGRRGGNGARGGVQVKVNDAISGAIFILLAGLIFYFTRDFRVMPGQNYGAAFFPRTIAVAMALFGVLLVVAGLRERAREPWFTRPDWLRSPQHISNFLLVLAVLVFYIALSDALGFLLTGFASLYLLLVWLRGRSFWLGGLIVSAVSVVLIQFLFGQLLRVPLPWGLLQPFAW